MSAQWMQACSNREYVIFSFLFSLQLSATSEPRLDSLGISQALGMKKEEIEEVIESLEKCEILEKRENGRYFLSI